MPNSISIILETRLTLMPRLLVGICSSYSFIGDHLPPCRSVGTLLQIRAWTTNEAGSIDLLNSPSRTPSVGAIGPSNPLARGSSTAGTSHQRAGIRGRAVCTRRRSHLVHLITLVTLSWTRPVSTARMRSPASGCVTIASNMLAAQHLYGSIGITLSTSLVQERTTVRVLTYYVRIVSGNH